MKRKNRFPWYKYGEVVAELDVEIAAQLCSMRRRTELPPKPRLCGRKPHDPVFDIREALDYLIGGDLTVIEGIDELNALTLVSELGTDFAKWPTAAHYASWLGLCPQFKHAGILRRRGGGC